MPPIRRKVRDWSIVKKRDNPGSSSLPTMKWTPPGGATGSQTVHGQVRMEKENAGESTNVKFCRTSVEYAIECDQRRAVLEEITSNHNYDKKMNKCSEENIVPQLKLRKADKENPVVVKEAPERFCDNLSNSTLSEIGNPSCISKCMQACDFPDKGEIDLQWKKGTKAKHANAGTVRQLSGSSVKVKKISNCEHRQLPNVTESQFSGDSYQQALCPRREGYGKLQNPLHEAMKQLGKSVCLLIINLGHDNPLQIQGTGFVLFDNFILTNAHLLEKCAQMPNWQTHTRVTALFNNDDTDPKSNSDGFTVKAVLVYNEITGLDYVILELEAANKKVPPGLLKKFGPLPLHGKACIIGYPGGGKRTPVVDIIEKEKREQAVIDHLDLYKGNDFMVQSIIDSIKLQGIEEIMPGNKRAEMVVTYNSLMYEGSSGSPVFDAHGRVFGLHTRGYVYDSPNPTRSVMEYARGLLNIFEDFVIKLKESRNKKMLNRIKEEAKGNSYLNLALELLVSLTNRNEELLSSFVVNTER